MRVLRRINLFLGQLVCIASALVSCGPELMDAIAATGKHTITFNVLHVVFLVLFLFSQFAAAEVILVLNFANMSMLYFRHHSYPHLVHSSLISGPLSWAFFALYWNGFCIAPPSEAARLIGSVFVWGILGYGLFFAFAYKVSKYFLYTDQSALTVMQDSSMCLFLSLLATSVGVYHARTPIAEIQEYTSPFVIAVALFSAATAIIISKLANKRRCRRMTKADGGDG